MRAPPVTAAVALLVAAALIPQTGGETVDRWSDGSFEFTWVQPSPIGGQTLRSFTVAKNSEIESASMSIGGDYFFLDEGTEYQSVHWPRNPSLDLFNDGTVDWRFPGVMGLQDTFANNNTEVDIRWDQNGLTKTLEFKMPRSTVRTASLAVNNSQTSKYAYTMSLGGATIWSKDSLSFTFYDDSSCMQTINHVAAGDIDDDGDLDIVAAGTNGKIYVAKNLGGLYINATEIDLGVEAADKNVTMVALGLLDDMPGLDIAASCADGNFYWLPNQGGHGLYGGAIPIITGAGSRMSSICIDDVEGNGEFDIVGGSLNGRIYVVINSGGGVFDTSGGPNSEYFKVISGATGQMNSVAVADIDEDSFLDIVGANANRQFYLARGLGDGSFETATPIATTAGRDMNSVSVADVDGDGDLDLVGASNDGRIYICLNLGYSQGHSPGEFDTQTGHILKVVCERGATDSLRTAAVADMNSDGAFDIVALGTSSSGQVFLQLNDGFGGFPEDLLIRPFVAGQSSRFLVVAPLDPDSDLDILVANGVKMDVWSNNQGKFNDVVSGPAFVAALQGYLDTATAVNDEWSNPIVTVKLQIHNRYTGQLRFALLNINYSYSALVDFTSQLFDHMNATAGPAAEGERVAVEALFKMESAGKLNVSALKVVAPMGLVAIIDFPLENATLYAGVEYELQGRSNYDPDGTLFNYSWTELPTNRFLGFGPRIKYVVPLNATNLTVQLTVRDELHQKEATTSVDVNVVEEPYAYLSITKIVLSPPDPREGEAIALRVTIRNTGKINASRVGVQLYLDRADGDPIASGVIERIGQGQFESIDISWQASSPGSHRILGAVVQCSERFKTPHSLETPFKSGSFKVEQKSIVGVLPIAAGVIVGFSVLGVVGFIIKRKRDELALKREQESSHAEAPVPEAAEGEMSVAPQVLSAEELYAKDREASTAAVAAPQTRIFPCPRCGKPTDEEGLLCLECNAREALESARKAVEAAREMALDVESAETMLKSAEDSFKAGKFADASESAADAEDEAHTATEAFERASAFATGKEKAIETELEELQAPPPVLKPRAPSPAPPVSTPPASRATAIGPATGSGAETLKCPKCGRATKPNWKICPNCQTKLQ
ncbi:MAG: FG-GAP-like repeat-containing protein [Thermoplasmatota archaeon]